MLIRHWDGDPHNTADRRYSWSDHPLALREQYAQIKAQEQPISAEGRQLASLPEWALDQIEAQTLKIHFGCGETKEEGYLGVDKVYYKGVDYLSEWYWNKLPFPDDSCERIIMRNVLQKVQGYEVWQLIDEAWRLLKNAGEFEIEVPDHLSADAVMPDNHSYWSALSFKGFTDGSYRTQLNMKALFDLISIEREMSVEEIGDLTSPIAHLKVILSAVK